MQTLQIVVSVQGIFSETCRFQKYIARGIVSANQRNARKICQQQMRAVWIRHPLLNIWPLHEETRSKALRVCVVLIGSFRGGSASAAILSPLSATSR
jgi:hypothetical protein